VTRLSSWIITLKRTRGFASPGYPEFAIIDEII
jgi:hypothetical protein